MKHILIINGHPDPDRSRFCYQLAGAYKKAAETAGHEVKEIFVADENFPLLKSKDDYYNNDVSPNIAESQKDIVWADHLLLVYPLWLGGMPALLKGFLEQVLRPGFAISETSDKWPQRLLTGKSARIVVTMGMPAFIYRWFFQAHSLKSLQRNILKFCGIHPVKTILFGMVESDNPKRRQKWLKKMQELGRRAD